MPSRYIREGIITSENVDALSWKAEVFYRRLLNIVDDYGRYYANPQILRAHLFPLRLNKVKDSDITEWLQECVNACLIMHYTNENKQYVEVYNFKQRLRTESKFPDCQADDSQMSDICRLSTNPRTNTNPRTSTKSRVFTPPSFEEFKFYCTENGFTSIAERAYKYYADSDWKDSQGKQVRSWKGKLQAVWFKQENRDKIEDNDGYA